MWFGSSPSCEKELPRRSRVFMSRNAITMSRIGESKVEWGPLRSPKSSQAQNTGKTKKKRDLDCTRNKVGPRLYKKQSGTQREKKHVLTLTLTLKYASASQICLQNLCGQQRNSPMADPIFGSKYGPQNGAQARPKRRNENVIQFWAPFWGPYLDQKCGQPLDA